MRKNPNENVKQITCAACNLPVMVDQWGQGWCSHCGWYNAEYNLDGANQVICPNMISLNRAKQLFADGKPFKPSLDDFVACWYDWGELEFQYNGRRYGLITIEDEIKFYEMKVPGSTQSFKTIEAFRDNAHIGGVLLKDLWEGIEEASIMRA